MLEGVFASLVGAAIAGTIVLVADTLLFDRMGRALPFLANVVSFTNGEIFSVLFVLLGVGAGVGIGGSSMPLRRFLEVYPGAPAAKGRAPFRRNTAGRTDLS